MMKIKGETDRQREREWGIGPIGNFCLTGVSFESPAVVSGYAGEEEDVEVPREGRMLRTCW